MIKDNHYYHNLFERYLQNLCTPEELEEVLDFIEKDKNSLLLLEKMRSSFKKAMEEEHSEQVSGWSDKVRARLMENIYLGKVVPFYKQQIFRVAAVTILAFSISLLFYLSNKKQPVFSEPLTTNKPAITLPGGDRATLTLADGSVVDLTEVENGNILFPNNTKVINTGGMIDYTAMHSEHQEVIYNTITTPRGGQYTIVLSDGSKVWLNASSSLRFPTTFNGAGRKVELKGEGYFEITSRRLPNGRKQSFQVAVNDASGNSNTIEVLGTHFNVMAYDEEEQIKTTLLEGSVKVNMKEKSVLLKPGQQARVAATGHKVETLSDIDMESVLAWKNGEFRFENMDLQTIMRQIGRWYDVTIVYEGNVPEIELSGKIKRNNNMEQILEIMQATHRIQFRTIGKTVYVSAYGTR